MIRDVGVVRVNIAIKCELALLQVFMAQVFAAGFEGDVSDENMDDTASVSDAGLGLPQLPHFWLILTISDDHVDLFFHTRSGLLLFYLIMISLIIIY